MRILLELTDMRRGIRGYILSRGSGIAAPGLAGDLIGEERLSTMIAEKTRRHLSATWTISLHMIPLNVWERISKSIGSAAHILYAGAVRAGFWFLSTADGVILLP